jgi:hypothetical protein
MVVRIKSGKSVKGIINYNERKVGQDKAELLLASGFSCNVEELTFSQKLRRFTKLNERNPKIKTNTVHISLNFPPDEKLDTETLQSIAADYMEKIGFGNQPYLVYQHHDADHPHAHIVTTTVQANGRPISLHNIGKLKSEPARKAIEKDYGLIVAESRKQTDPFKLHPADLKPAKYGEAETKKTISNIVREVTSNYKYTSLEELNAILKEFNVAAFKANGGLVYSTLDKKGNRIGHSIKASSIYTSPTLKTLEKNFKKNQVKKIPCKKYTQGKVDAAAFHSSNLQEFIERLKKKNVQCQLEKDKNGKIKSIYFIDQANRTVFEAGELGHSCDTLYNPLKHAKNKDYQSSSGSPAQPSVNQDSTERIKMNISIELIKNLLSAQSTGADLDPGFTKKKKKRKKRPS